MRGGLFHVGIAGRLYGFGAVVRVLEIGCGDNDRIHIFTGIQFIVVPNGVGTVSAKLFNESCAFIAAAVPDIGDGHDLEVELLGILLERGQIAAFHAITTAHDADAHAIVRARDLPIAFRVP